MSQAFLIRPLDSLFFRDGRPFNQEDEGMADARSVFPPFPQVLTGAFRAAAARGQGWDETRDKSWKGVAAKDRETDIADVLGDGLALPDDLRFGPPVVVREADTGWERLYPVPLHLAGKRRGEKRFHWSFIAPDPKRRLICDLSENAVALPSLSGEIEGAEPLGRKWWLTPAGLQRALAGEFPTEENLVEAEEVLANEYRIGLQRDSATRTAVSGALYAASHVRVVDGVQHKGAKAPRVALGLMVRGLDPAWCPTGLHPVGGFQRLAAFDACDDWQCAVSHGPLKGGDGKYRYVVVLTSPTKLVASDIGWRTRDGRLGSHERIVAACIERPLMIGGWDGIGSGPRPLEPCLPPGSVFFIEADSAPAVPPEPIGRCTKHGFGECVIGRWPQPALREDTP
jgi:CRISPR-associated protein Cmr3